MLFAQETIICGVSLVAATITAYLFLSPRLAKQQGDDWHIKPVQDEDDDTVIRFCSAHHRGDTLVGHLYLPKDQSAPFPVVVFCLGLGLTQDANLHQFVQGIVKGCQVAVFTFDYRTFGESGGYPRHQVKPSSHVADIRSAVECMRNHPKIDRERIGLWGSSLGGGHVLMVAAKDTSLKAVVSLVPHITSGLEGVIQTVIGNPVMGLVGLANVGGALLRAIGFVLLWGAESYLPLHGLPGSAAMMQNPGDDEGYGALPPKDRHWRNAATVGSVPAVLFYRPLNHVHSIQSPALLLVASRDTLCPPAGAKRAARRIPTAEVVMLEGSAHFDVYKGATFEKVIVATAHFFNKHL